MLCLRGTRNQVVIRSFRPLSSPRVLDPGFQQRAATPARLRTNVPTHPTAPNKAPCRRNGRRGWSCPGHRPESFRSGGLAAPLLQRPPSAAQVEQMEPRGRREDLSGPDAGCSCARAGAADGRFEMMNLNQMASPSKVVCRISAASSLTRRHGGRAPQLQRHWRTHASVYVQRH